MLVIKVSGRQEKSFRRRAKAKGLSLNEWVRQLVDSVYLAILVAEDKDKNK